MSEREFRRAVREAVALYVTSTGCGCCAGSDLHENEEALAKLLRIRKYSDGSGYDWPAVATRALAKKERLSKRAGRKA